MSGPAFATVGHLVVDLILSIQELPVRPFEHQIAEILSIEPGGLGNVLVMAARLGMHATALGWLGDDFYGDRVLELLDGEGVDIGHVQRLAGASTVAFVLVDTAGRHVFLGARGVRGPERMPESWRSLIGGIPWILSDGYALTTNPRLVLEAFALAHHAGGGTTVFDPGPLASCAGQSVAEVLQLSAVLLLTEHEAAGLVERGMPASMAQALLARGPRLVVMKRGGEGSLVVTSEDAFSQPAFPTQVRDTTGAGDAFDAAFIAGMAHGLSVRQAAILANGVGAVAVSKLGTGTRLPTREEVYAFLKMHGVEPNGLLPRIFVR